MHTIKLEQLLKYNQQEIYKYIMQQNTNTFQICVTKNSINPIEDPFDVFWMYWMAAFMGQKLNEIATTFAYYVPCIDMQDEFRFTIQVTDKEILADVLWFILSGFFVLDENTGNQFNQEASNFFDEAFKNENMIVACWGLLEIANRHLSKDAPLL